MPSLFSPLQTNQAVNSKNRKDLNEDQQNQKKPFPYAHFIVPAVMLLIFILIIVLVKTTRPTSQQKQYTFIEIIWLQIEGQTNLYNQILSTSFMTGVKDGNLNPLIFAKYMIQRIFYNEKLYDLWNQACTQAAVAGDTDFLTYCQSQAASILAYSDNIRNTIPFPGAVDPLSIVTKYTDQQNTYFQSHQYHYVLIVTYATYKLYGQLVKNLLPSLTSASNAYYSWLNGLSDLTYLTNIQDRINQYQTFYGGEQIKSEIAKLYDYELQYLLACLP